MLTDEQYAKVVRDAFGVELTAAEAAITTAGRLTGNYTNFSESFRADVATVQAYHRAARAVSAKLKPCPEPADAACVGAFINGQVARAWRRPLEAQESAALLRIFTDNVGASGASRAMELVIQAALQSGSFIYRSELGQAPVSGKVRLTSHELASALSFLFLDSIPDAPLWERALDGTLLDPTVLSQQVNRLLALPQVQARLTEYLSFWSGAEFIPFRNKSSELFPEFTPSLKTALHQSTVSFLGSVLASGSFTEMLTSARIFANDELAQVYGLPPPGGNGLSPVSVPQGYPRAGLLSQPGFLAATNQRPERGDPIHRGLFIYNALVCGAKLPAPPAGALDAAAAMMGTERELAVQRAQAPGCAACHSAFDPLGLALEAFDPIGRHRVTWEDGSPVDSSATLAGLGPELDGPVSGVEELASRLAQSRKASDCTARTLSRYALGYSAANHSCDNVAAEEAFAQTGSFLDLFRAFATAPGYLERAIELP
jgi:hypothetical protein